MVPLSRSPNYCFQGITLWTSLILFSSILPLKLKAGKHFKLEAQPNIEFKLLVNLFIISPDYSPTYCFQWITAWMPAIFSFHRFSLGNFKLVNSSNLKFNPERSSKFCWLTHGSLILLAILLFPLNRHVNHNWTCLSVNSNIEVRKHRCSLLEKVSIFLNNNAITSR